MSLGAAGTSARATLELLEFRSAAALFAASPAAITFDRPKPPPLVSALAN